MMMRSWVRRLFTHPVARTIRPVPHRARPALEVLEDRCVPSTIVVNNPTDINVPGQTDLRQAIAQANAAGGAQTITFDSTVFGTPRTITLTGSQLELSDTSGAETITGPAAGVTVSGGGKSRVFQVDGGVTASISGLTITGGSAGGSNAGGVFNGGSLAMTNCTVSGNSIGGLANFALGTLTLTNSTVSGNSGRGLLVTGGTAALTNCTVSGSSQGLIVTGGTATLTNCTVSGNGIGIRGRAALTNCIVAANTSFDVFGVVASGGHNLIGTTDHSSGWVGSDLTGTSAQPLNPDLAPLGNYGGPTQTMPLLPGSPAIDAGTSGAGIPTTDQRGLGRVGAIDIGAFESQGTALVVNTTAGGAGSEPGQLSLPQAVNLANALATANTITFDPTVFATPQTITLGGSQLELSDTSGTETITGPAAGVTVNGVGLSRVFQVDGGVTASISGLTISGGNAYVGGGVENYGSLALTNCTVSGNSASSTNYPAHIGGGGVENHGSLALTNCTVSGNSAYIGGGVNNFGSLVLTNCTVSGNHTSSVYSGGGAVANFGGTATLTNCTVSGNSAIWGGGLYNAFGGTATLANCTISGNSAIWGGGVFTSATTTLTNCTVSGNSATNGGGVNNWPGGTATLTNCTVSGNSATNGGGLANFNGTTATLTNCTVSGNSASGSGGGLFNSYYGTATLTNTIVAGNTGGDFSGGFSGTNNLIGGNPLLAPLGNYGGPTQTMPLLPGSPAIDAGTSGAGIPTTDQRGLGRVGAIDIGAFESQGFTLTPVPGSTPQTSDIGTPFANPLAVTVAANNPIEPVNGGVVSFVANRVNGATAILLGPAAAVIGGGPAAVTAAPNNMDGNYQVTASVLGSSPASFDLTNTGPVFAKLIVNTTSDSLFPGAGLLSLREAILFADFDYSGNSNVTFDKQVFNTPQTITLTGTQLELSSTIETETITGPSSGLTINGGGLSRVFQVDGGVTASISGLTISGGNADVGGGVFNGGSLAMTNCTVSGNSASNGGGLANYGVTATLTNCTVSGNSASGSGGGLYNAFGDTATLTNCTVSGNSATFGGGLNNYGTATLTNTIVAGQTAGGDISGTVVGSNNLIGTGGSGGLVNGVNGNIVGVANPLLAPLGNYGGPTQTMPPLPGSPAIDAGTSGAGIPATDQRGLGRVGQVDIGAVERQAPTITVPAAQTAFEDVDRSISGIGVGGDPQGQTPFTVTLTVGHGTLTLATSSGLTVTGNGSGLVSLSGSIADINAALAGLVYRGTLNYSGPDTLNLTASDGNRSTQASVSITVKSAAAQAADLQTQVSALQSAGVLNQGQANSLIVKLNLKGNNGDIGKVQAFLNEVAADLKAGILTQAQADALLGPGNILLLSVTRR